MAEVPMDPLCPEAWDEIRVGCTIHCRSWLVLMAVTVGTNEPGISTPPMLPPGSLPTLLNPPPAGAHSCGRPVVVGGLPKESTEEMY